MRMGIAGITGRMGRLVVAELANTEHVLVGGLSRTPASHGFHTAADLARDCDVLIDFTQADSVIDHASAVSAQGCAWVLGTTGLSAEAEAAVLAASSTVPIVWAANFSPGITLLLNVATQLASSLPPGEYDAEILEMHHRYKTDAPSGTALALGDAVAAARGTTLEAQRASHGRTGPRRAGAIGFASLRGGAVVGDHTLLFAGDGDQISIRHTATDRAIFARGAILAAQWTQHRAPGLYGMAHVLGLKESRP